MRRASWIILAAALAGVWGCAGAHPVPPPAAVAVTRPAGGPMLGPRAMLTLDEIEPRPTLQAAAARPGDAPLAALQLYAQARAALVDNQRFTAINLLESAIAIDPDSYELYSTLGKAYLAAGGSPDKAIDALENAARIQPNHLYLQYELGRQCLLKGERDKAALAKALEHFRLAIETTEYKHDDDLGTLTDFFLARALQQAGYLRAALDRYDLLLAEANRPAPMRANAELSYLIAHPEVIEVQIGEIDDQMGRYAAARAAYDEALKRDPENYAVRTRAIRAQFNAGDRTGASAAAGQLVIDFHALPDSLDFLKEIYRLSGSPDGALDALASLHARQPGDTSILFALTDLEASSGRWEDAEKLLRDASAATGDLQVVKRLLSLYQEHGDALGAARLLVSTLSQRPESLRDIRPLFADLLRPGRGGRLRVSTLQKLQVPPSDEASRLFWISQLAAVWDRDLLARSALEQAVACKPPFAPAYRALVQQIWQRPDWDEAQRVQACEKLAESARQQNRRSLAAEITGLSLLNQKKPAEAADALAAAARMGNHTPELELLQIGVLLDEGQNSRAEQRLWRLISDWPHYEDAYAELVHYYIGQQSPDQASVVLRKWLEAEPRSAAARLLQANFSLAVGRPDLARAIVLGLFAEEPDDPQVLLGVREFFDRIDDLDELADRLQEQFKRHPDDPEVVQALVEVYAKLNRNADAQRLLEAARAAVPGEPDLLYFLAHLYERIDLKQMTEQVLQEVVRLDPTYAPASNDLGYYWADEGRNLERAENLIRVAVDAEPDNQSYLDSMGWVSYKLGKFPQAKEFLDKAIAPSSRPDPVILDHLGDVLYQLKDRDGAATVWKRSLRRLDDEGPDVDRDDLKALRTQLLRKIEQQQKGEPVTVAPLGQK